MEPLVLIKWVEAGLWLVSIEGTYCNWTESFERASHWPASVLSWPWLESKPGRTMTSEDPGASDQEADPGDEELTYLPRG